MFEDHVWHPRLLRGFMLLAPSELPSMYYFFPLLTQALFVGVLKFYFYMHQSSGMPEQAGSGLDFPNLEIDNQNLRVGCLNRHKEKNI